MLQVRRTVIGEYTRLEEKRLKEKELSEKRRVISAETRLPEKGHKGRE